MDTEVQHGADKAAARADSAAQAFQTPSCGKYQRQSSPAIAAFRTLQPGEVSKSEGNDQSGQVGFPASCQSDVKRLIQALARQVAQDTFRTTTAASQTSAPAKDAVQ